MQARKPFNAGSAIQISEGSLNEITNVMIRLRELGIQAASDNIGDKERGFLNEEAKQILQESDRIAKTTTFGNSKLLDGSGGEKTFQVGNYNDENNRITYTLDSNATNSALGVDGIDLSDKSGARDTLAVVDQALDKIGSMRANFGAVQSRLNSTTENLDTQYENLSAANSRIRDVDVAKETADMASASVLQSAGVSVLAQANQFPNIAMKLL
jgi:flagellin